MENLFEKFKDIDSDFQLIPGVEGHVIFLPRRNTAFMVGKALQKVDSETDFTMALKDSLMDYSTIGRYLRESKNMSDFGTRTAQVVIDTACCNVMGLTDDVGAGIAGSYSAHRIQQMADAISRNETMAGPASALRDFDEGRKRIKLRIRGPKGNTTNIDLAPKPKHPKFEDLFNKTNSIRGGSLEVEVNKMSDKKRLFDLILENKTKISFVLICGAIVYICFKKFSFIRKFYQKIKNISKHWIFTNRLTRGIVVIWRYTSSS